MRRYDLLVCVSPLSGCDSIPQTAYKRAELSVLAVRRVPVTIESAKPDVWQAAVEFCSKAHSALSDADNAMSQRMNCP